MNKLIWQLFEMLREVMPPSADNTRRFAEWATEFKHQAGEDRPLGMPFPEESGDPPFEPAEEHELAELEETHPSRSSSSHKSKHKRK